MEITEEITEVEVITEETDNFEGVMGFSNLVEDTLAVVAEEEIVVVVANEVVLLVIDAIYQVI